MLRCAKLSAAVVLGLLLQGCAVKPINSDGGVTSDVAACPTGQQSNDAVSQLCGAINLADGYRRGYLRRASTLGGTREGLGFAAIGASVLGLYYAASPQPTRLNAAGESIATSNYAQRVRRMGAVGAGGYAVGQWGFSKARDLVYLDGAQAMTCAVLKASPAIPALQDHARIERAYEALDREIVNVEGALKGSQTLGNRAEAEALLLDARNLRDEAYRLMGEAEAAGHQLRARVQLIDIEVRRRVVNDSPSFESLVALTASLPGVARSLGSDLSPIKGTTKPAAVPDGGASAASGGVDAALISLEALREAVSDLRRYLHALTRIRGVVESVEQCAVAGGAAFRLVPAETNASIAKGARYEVVVTDPVGHPSATLAGGQADALLLKPIEITGKPHEYRVIVEGTKPTQSGDLPVLAVRSASGISGADIRISVSSAAPADGGAKDPAPAENTGKPDPATTGGECEAKGANGAATACAFDASYIKDPYQVLAIQCLVGAAPDCRMGAKTRDKIRAYRVDQDLPAGNHIDAALKERAADLILAINAARQDFTCPAEPGTLTACPNVLTP